MKSLKNTAITVSLLGIGALYVVGFCVNILISLLFVTLSFYYFRVVELITIVPIIFLLWCLAEPLITNWGGSYRTNLAHNTISLLFKACWAFLGFILLKTSFMNPEFWGSPTSQLFNGGVGFLLFAGNGIAALFHSYCIAQLAYYHRSEAFECPNKPE